MRSKHCLFIFPPIILLSFQAFCNFSPFINLTISALWSDPFYDQWSLSQPKRHQMKNGVAEGGSPSPSSSTSASSSSSPRSVTIALPLTPSISDQQFHNIPLRSPAADEQQKLAEMLDMAEHGRANPGGKTHLGSNGLTTVATLVGLAKLAKIL